MANTLRVWGGSGKGGISTRGDVLVNMTADGVDLNEIWDEVAQVLELWNAERKNITSLLTFRPLSSPTRCRRASRATHSRKPASWVCLAPSGRPVITSSLVTPLRITTWPCGVLGNFYAKQQPSKCKPVLPAYWKQTTS